MTSLSPTFFLRGDPAERVCLERGSNGKRAPAQTRRRPGGVRIYRWTDLFSTRGLFASYVAAANIDIPSENSIKAAPAATAIHIHRDISHFSFVRTHGLARCGANTAPNTAALSVVDLHQHDSECERPKSRFGAPPIPQADRWCASHAVDWRTPSRRLDRGRGGTPHRLGLRAGRVDFTTRRAHTRQARRGQALVRLSGVSRSGRPKDLLDIPKARSNDDAMEMTACRTHRDAG